MNAKRRKYTQKIKAAAVQPVTDQGYQLTEAARNLGIHETLLGRWKREIEGAQDESSVLSKHAKAMQDELTQLRKEKMRLKMECELLKKAEAFVAKEMS